MFPSDMTIEDFDDELWHAIQGETQRQEDHIELIASENYASPGPSRPGKRPHWPASPSAAAR